MFTVEQRATGYRNPKDTLIAKDSRMKAALKDYATQMRKAGFNVDNPSDVEADVSRGLAALTKGATVKVGQMTPSQRAALAELQDYERRLAVKDMELAEEIIEPVEDEIKREIYARKID